MRAAEAWPAVEPALSAPTVALARQLYEAIGARLERQRVLCGRCGRRACIPRPGDEGLETWAAFCGTGAMGMTPRQTMVEPINGRCDQAIRALDDPARTG